MVPTEKKTNQSIIDFRTKPIGIREQSPSA